MLGDGEEIISRHALLSMVKKHSTLLEKGPASDVEMDGPFWYDMLDLYFIRGKESRGRQDDDLVFFVRKMGTEGYGFDDSVQDLPLYFVRRWAPKLDNLVSENSEEIDWMRSFYLNLIAHTSFTVTVAICSHHILSNHQAGRSTPLSPILKVVKTVYASPSRVDFQLDSKKEVETTTVYPDICFAVDDFDSTLNTVILGETDHCYCVILNAHDGAAFPSEKDNTSSTNSTHGSSGKKKNSKLTLFSGFVNYQMVREAYDAGKSGFGNLLSLGHSLGKTDKLYMKGPGGRGKVEVAVSGVADWRQQDLDPSSPVTTKKGYGIGSIARKVASVASVAAKHAYAAAAASTSSDDEILPLKCCLMSVSLPWEHIAYNLLFKVSSPSHSY